MPSAVFRRGVFATSRGLFFFRMCCRCSVLKMSCLSVTSFDIDFPQAVSLRYRLYCCCGFVEVLMIEDADAAWREFFKVFFSSARAFASTLNTRKLLDCDKRLFLIRDLLICDRLLELAPGVYKVKLLFC